MTRSGKVRTDVATVQEAIELCEENAKRFLRNASILLDHQGSDGLAYVLWSLAVEEFGKGVLLRDQIDALAPAHPVEIEASWNHQTKFEAGFSQLVELQGTQLAWVLRVTGNISDDSVAIEDPIQPGVAVSIPPSSTGLFSDGLGGGVDATVALRFAFLYVDWQQATNKWVRPGKTYRRGGVVARWELDRPDLQQAIEVLLRRVEGRTT